MYFFLYSDATRKFSLAYIYSIHPRNLILERIFGFVNLWHLLLPKYILIMPLNIKNFFLQKVRKKTKKKRFCNLKCNVWGHLTGRECTYDIWFQQLQRDNINVIKRCSGWLMQFLLFSAKYIILAHIVRKLYIPMLFICCWQSLFVFFHGKILFALKYAWNTYLSFICSLKFVTISSLSSFNSSWGFPLLPFPGSGSSMVI